MPEGPEVRVLRDQLRVVTGEYLLQLHLEKWLGKKHPLPSFYPAKVKSVESLGKKLCFVFESGQLVISLGMEGHLSWGEPKHLGAKLIFGSPTSYTERLPLEWQIFSSTRVVYYGDARHFGHFQWFPTGVKIDVGYDLLANSLLNYEETLEIALPMWRAWKKRFPKWQLCQALMNQDLFAGIGNYCKSECLYRAKVRPDRLLSTLSEEEDVAILREAVLVMMEAYKVGGTTLFTFSTMEEEKGPYVNQLLVYQREVDNLGYKVERKVLKDKRTSHFVPEIQM
jgi:formamidopyrimidine-DNA glycosylase